MPTLVYVITVPLVLSVLLGICFISLDRSPFFRTASLMLMIGTCASLIVIDGIDFVIYLRSDSDMPVLDRLGQSWRTMFPVAYALLLAHALDGKTMNGFGDRAEDGDLGARRP